LSEKFYDCKFYHGSNIIFEAVGASMTCLVVTSGHSQKRGSFLSQKANRISSIINTNIKNNK
jgi:hypothetical protein